MSDLAERLRMAAESDNFDAEAALWPELCAVVEAAESLASAADNAERSATLGDLYNALAALARRIDEEGL